MANEDANKGAEDKNKASVNVGPDAAKAVEAQRIKNEEDAKALAAREAIVADQMAEIALRKEEALLSKSDVKSVSDDFEPYKGETKTKKVAGRRGLEGETAEFATLDLVADRMGQVMRMKRNGTIGAVWIGRNTVDGEFIPTAFSMDCEIVKGVPKIPKWAHMPDEDEAKIIEQKRLQAHFDEGNKRAINPRKLQA